MHAAEEVNAQVIIPLFLTDPVGGWRAVIPNDWYVAVAFLFLLFYRVGWCCWFIPKNIKCTFYFVNITVPQNEIQSESLLILLLIQYQNILSIVTR